MASKIERWRKPELILSTDKLVVYDAIAGEHFGEYDDKILIFGKDIVRALKYIRLCYDYPFTGDHSVSWLKAPPLENRVMLDYLPATKINYYVYNELQHKFKFATKLSSPISVLAIGTNYGIIELLARENNKLGPETTYIATNYFTDKLDVAKVEILQEMANKNINVSNVITTTNDIYQLLELAGKIGKPVDIYAYDNFEMVKHFDLMFAHTHTLSNIIGIISGLRYTKPGGIFIIHMYSIINKTNADLYLLAKQYFNSASLYMPECVNPFKHSGTWAIFTGFRGIPDAEYKHLLDIVAQIKTHYPNGIHDSQVYEPEIRAKCWARKIFPRPGPRVPYITGFFSLGLTDPRYREIIQFNNEIYARKLEFCNRVLSAMSSIKYPEHLDIPTQRQINATTKYLQSWNLGYKKIKASSSSMTKKKGARPFTYLVKSSTFTPAVIQDEFARRGNWIPYDEKSTVPVDFFFIDGKSVDDSSLYNIKSNLKSLVGDSKKRITDKNNLYKNLSQNPATRKFLPVTVPFSIRNTEPKYLDKFRSYFKSGKPYICKVIKGGAGMGIVTTDKFSVFQAFMMGYYNRMRSNPGKFKQYDWVLQEYITNPWLVDGKKMHLRQIMIYQPGRNKPSYYMYMGEFALAEKPYVRGNWENKAVHDTHFHHGIGYEWPFDMNFTMEQWTKVKAQFEYIYACVLDVMKGHGDCYSDSKQCFELLGLDFMITKDLRVVLIEVNDKIGMTPSKVFADKIFKSLMVYVVDEYYPPKYIQQEYLTFYPIKQLVSGPSPKLKSQKTRKQSSKYLL